MRDLRAKIARRARRAGLSIAPDVVDGLESYFEILRLWNRKIGLTALPVEVAGDEAIDRLLIEPVLAARQCREADAILIDIGSGGGSPAIPMKLAVPGILLRMVEPKARKAAFLREVCRQLGLVGTAEVEAARFEQLLSRPDLHERADLVTLRAVRIEAAMLRGLLAFLRPGGRLFLFRSASRRDEQDFVQPPLVWRGSVPLVEAIGSQLIILEKMPSFGASTSERV